MWAPMSQLQWHPHIGFRSMTGGKHAQAGGRPGQQINQPLDAGTRSTTPATMRSSVSGPDGWCLTSPVRWLGAP